jgi:hypothetical protein
MTRNDRTDLLIDDLDDDLPPHLRALLADHTTGPALSSAAERRLLARVVMTVGAAAVVGAGTAASTAAASSSIASTGSATAATTAATTATATSMSALTSAVVFKVAVGVACVAGVVGVGASVGVVGTALTARDEQTVVTTTTSAMPAAPAPAAAGAAAAAVALSPSPPPVVEPHSGAADVNDVAVRTPNRVHRATAVEAPGSRAVVDSVVEVDEVAVLAAVRDTLAAGNPQRALGLLDELDHDVPSTRFAEERLALRVIALSRAGMHDAATSLSATFFARFPASMLTARVRAALATAAH